MGTNGTITGVTEVIKIRKHHFKAIALEPTSSPVLSGGTPGSDKIQRIGAGFVPQILKVELIDKVITITDDEAIAFSKRLALEESLFSEISNGAALCAAINVGKGKENKRRLIVLIQASFGERYLSMPLFQDVDVKGVSSKN